MQGEPRRLAGKRGNAGGQTVRKELFQTGLCHAVPELCLIESRKAAVIHLHKARLAGGVGIVRRRFHGIGAGKQLGQDGLRLLPGGVAAQAGEREHRRNGYEKDDQAQGLLAERLRLHTMCPPGRKSLVLVGFQLLLLGDVGFHLRFSPALQIGLALPGDAQRLCGHILSDGAAGGGVGTVAHLDRGHKVGVAADEAVVPDGGAELVLAVVVAGDGAAAEVAVLAYIAVADVGQVADGVAPGKVGVLRLDISAQMHAVAGDGVDAHMGEGADVVVGAEVAAVDLAGVDGGAFVHGAVLDEGVGADDAACADGGLAAQDGACEDGGSRGNDHFGADLHIAAADVHAVCDVAQQHLFALGLGSVELCLCGSQCGCVNVLHK